MIKVKFLLTIITCFFSILLSAQKKADNFEIQGKLIGRNNGKIILNYVDANEKYQTDTATVHDGNFTFSGKVKEPGMATLIGKPASASVDDPDFTDFYIEPGQIKVAVAEHHFKQLKVTGSKIQNEYNAFRSGEEHVFQTYDSLKLVFENILLTYRGGDTSDLAKTKMADVREKAVYYSNVVRELHYNYAISHSNSYLSAIFLYMYRPVKLNIMSIDSAMQVYDKLSPRIKESYSGKLIFKDINARIVASVGKQAPLLKTVNWDGIKVDLSSYKAKSYVLLDFWASWCVPCREATPNLKKLYQKYHDQGLEIISLSSDDNKKAWQNAVKKDSTLIWKNAIIGSNSLIAKKYYVQAIPAYIVIDKEGKIIGRFEDSSAVEKEGNLTLFLRNLFE